MDTKKMAKKLKELRGNKTQKEVAEATGITLSSYAMYELGARIPSDERKKKIADYYKRTVQFIFFT